MTKAAPELSSEIEKWISAREPEYLLNWFSFDYSKLAIAKLAFAFEFYELKKIQALWITLEMARKEFLEFQKFEKAHIGAKEITRKLARIRKNPDEFPALFSSNFPDHPSELEQAVISAPEMQNAFSEMQENIDGLIRERGSAILLALESTKNSDEAEEPPYADNFRRYDPISGALLYFHQKTLFDAINPEFRKKYAGLFLASELDGEGYKLPSIESPKYQKYLCELVEAHLRPAPFERRKNIKRYAWTARVVNFCCDELGIPYTRNKEKDGIPSQLESFVEGCLSLQPLDDWQGVRNLIHRHKREYWRDFSVDRFSDTERTDAKKRK